MGVFLCQRSTEYEILQPTLHVTICTNSSLASKMTWYKSQKQHTKQTVTYLSEKNERRRCSLLQTQQFTKIRCCLYFGQIFKFVKLARWWQNFGCGCWGRISLYRGPTTQTTNQFSQTYPFGYIASDVEIRPGKVWRFQTGLSSNGHIRGGSRIFTPTVWPHLLLLLFAVGRGRKKVGNDHTILTFLNFFFQARTSLEEHFWLVETWWWHVGDDYSHRAVVRLFRKHGENGKMGPFYWKCETGDFALPPYWKSS